MLLQMRMNKIPGFSNATLLKWAVIPLLTFLLAGLLTKKLLPDNRGVEEEPFQQTVAASLKKLDSGDRAGAVEGLARAGKSGKGDGAGQTSLIPKFHALGEHKLAAEAMEQSIRGAPKEKQTARSYASLCEYLLEHGELDNAKRVLTGDLMARWPDTFETACLQAEVALKGANGRDDIAAAVKQFHKCLAMVPGHAPSKLHLGIAYSRLGEWDNAEPVLRAALEKRPFDPLVLYHLGEVLRQQEKTAEAAKYQQEHKRISALQGRRKHLEAQYSLRKHQPADLLELGRIYDQLGEFSRAASTLRVYTRHQPADADGQRELARISLKLDDKAADRVATGLADDPGAALEP